MFLQRIAKELLFQGRFFHMFIIIIKNHRVTKTNWASFVMLDYTKSDHR